jgi:insulysin
MKYLLFLIFLNLSLYAQNNQSTHTILQDLSTPSACLNRKTEKVILENGLQIYLISDPFVKQSAAAVVVETGLWDDPKEYPGMAHFVEHLLFMGTKTYPKESEYTQFIEDHGGVKNAFTTTDKTVYAFSVHHEAYAQALDRFSHFFIDPLFSTSCISRELHAVKEEHAKNSTNDWWRLQMVLQETANPLHPYHYFSCGNQETLSRIPLAVLQDWYAAHYSADRMHLVMLSSSSLSEMRNLAIAHFTPVVRVANKMEKKPLGPIFSDQQKASMIFINPIKDCKTLSLCWEIPTNGAILDEKFPEFAAYLLKKEVKGSLLAKLKKE